ncbi:MAG: patatin-like phospholipase family protein [Nitrosarchaeum sp.]|nr:patatin-like phospholipase family protein [Nitrosarchaeum sp.]
MKKIPLEERAMILQGGGSLGAYEVGAYKASYQFIKHRDKAANQERQVFDIIAGTSIGAINSAILTSYVVENRTWEGSVERLIDFWNYLSTESISDKFSNYMTNWWDNYRNFFTNIASGETARRYYSSKEFTVTGVSKVFSNPQLVPDNRFFDMFNVWYRYDSKPLKESLEKFAKFPIATSRENDQPRLLLVTTDVGEGMPVVFDSYEKEDGRRHSGYGKLIVDKNDKKNSKIGFEHVVRYDDGITADHVIASASVPVSYDYVKMDAERYDPKTKSYKKEERFFWDGGILINTPLMQVILSQRQYWYFGKGVIDMMPKLNVFQVNLNPSRIDNIPLDFDGVKNRVSDIVFADRTKNDETLLLLIQSYQEIIKKLITLSIEHGVKQEIIDKMLDAPLPMQERFVGAMATKYRDFVEGALNIGEIIRIEREHDEYAVSNKVYDFTSNTIKHLMQDGYDDTIDYLKTRFSLEYLKKIGLQINV